MASDIEGAGDGIVDAYALKVIVFGRSIVDGGDVGYAVFVGEYNFKRSLTADSEPVVAVVEQDCGGGHQGADGECDDAVAECAEGLGHHFGNHLDGVSVGKRVILRCRTDEYLTARIHDDACCCLFDVTVGRILAVDISVVGEIDSAFGDGLCIGICVAVKVDEAVETRSSDALLYLDFICGRFESVDVGEEVFGDFGFAKAFPVP